MKTATQILGKFFSFFILLLCLTSCYMREFPLHGDFDGVKTSIDRQHNVSVLFIHGVGGYSEGEPDEMINAIVKKLGLCKTGDQCWEIARNSCNQPKVYGYLRRQDFADPCSASGIRFYTLDWKASIWEAKAYLRHIDRQCASTRDRLCLIKQIKKEVINNGLADVLLYFSKYHEEVQFPFEQAIGWIEEDSCADACHEIIVVGFSLGSTIFLNTLDEMHCKDKFSQVSVDGFVNKISSFFMLSNTHPLFELTEKNPCGSCCDSTVLSRFIQRKRVTLPEFQIVAFSDPNDPLSYIVQDYYLPSTCYCKNAFVNEKVRNAKWSLFGFVNPINAHTGYWENSKVIDAITFGVRYKRKLCLR